VHALGPQIAGASPERELQKLYATPNPMGAYRSELTLKRHPNQMDAGISLAFQMEDATTQECGEPRTSADRAPELIARNRGGGKQ
jgi:hypothetical protein